MRQATKKEQAAIKQIASDAVTAPEETKTAPPVVEKTTRGRVKTLEDVPEQFDVISFDNLVPTELVCKAFNRSSMTIFNWRTTKGLPFVKIGAGELPKVRFRPEKVMEWAREHGIDFDQDVFGC